MLLDVIRKWMRSRSESGEIALSDVCAIDLKKRAMHGAISTVITRIVIQLSQLLGTVILAHILAPDDFGLVAMCAVFTNILVEFGSLRISDAIIQRERVTQQQVSALFWINIGLSLLFAFIFAVISPLIATFYGQPKLVRINIVLALSFVFSGLSIQPLALMQRHMQFARIALNQTAATVVTEILAIAMALLGCGYWSLVVRRVGVLGFTCIGAWLLCGWRPGRPRRAEGIGDMLRFGLHSLGNYTMTYLSRSTDKFIVGWRFGAAPLGHYDRAYNLFVVPINQLSYPLTNVAVSTLSKMRGDRDRYIRYYLAAVSGIAFVGMPLSVVLTLSGRDIIRLFFGANWNQAGQIFTILGPAVGCMLLYGTDGWLHLSLGRADRWFRWSLISFGVTAFLLLFGLRYGPLGVAAAYGGSFYILLVPGLYYAGVPIKLGISRILIRVAPYFLAAAIAGVATWVIMRNFGILNYGFVAQHIFLRIVLVSAMSTMFYMAFLLLPFPEKSSVREVLKIFFDFLPISSFKRLSGTTP